VVLLVEDFVMKKRLTDLTINQLTKMWKDKVGELLGLQRRESGVVYDEGEIGVVLRDTLTPLNKWCKWQEENNIPRSNMWTAIKFYTRAREEGLDRKGVSKIPYPDALIQFNLAKKVHAEEDEVVDESQGMIAEEVKPPKKKKVKKPTQCEIDSATKFVAEVGDWDRAEFVLTEARKEVE
jgi:hypothetical protein